MIVRSALAMKPFAGVLLQKILVRWLILQQRNVVN